MDTVEKNMGRHKKNTKTRFVKGKKYAQGTGSGPPLPPSMETTLDEKILNIIPMVTIKGDKNISESLVSLGEDNAYVGDKDRNKENEEIVTSEQSECNQDHVYYVRGNEMEEKGEKTASVLISGPTYFENSNFNQTASCSHTPSTSTKKKIRLNKTTRLQESLKTNSRFIDINEVKFANDKSYQDKKILLIEKELKNTEIFQERVASALESMAESFRKIATEMPKT